MTLEKIKTSKFNEFSKGDKNLSQIIMLYILHLHGALCLSYLN